MADVDMKSRRDGVFTANYFAVSGAGLDSQDMESGQHQRKLRWLQPSETVAITILVSCEQAVPLVCWLNQTQIQQLSYTEHYKSRTSLPSPFIILHDDEKSLEIGIKLGTITAEYPVEKQVQSLENGAGIRQTTMMHWTDSKRTDLIFNLLPRTFTKPSLSEHTPPLFPRCVLRPRTP